MSLLAFSLYTLASSLFPSLMRNPLQRLKYLPWLPLSLTALATALITFLLELGLALSYQFVPALQGVFAVLFSPLLGTIVFFAMALGVGALAVYWLERLYPQIAINTGILWALVLCVMVAFFLKSLLPLPVNLVTPGQFLLIGVVVGIFWKGRRYWRY
jgi:hypothetical protein